MYTKIIGTGSYLPEQVRTNADLEKMVDTSDEWIVTRTGIRERHIAAPNETVSTMGFEAATRAIEMAGIEKDQIGLIVVATTSATHAFPSAACQIQSMLGIKGCPAFDVAAACAGFTYALSVEVCSGRRFRCTGAHLRSNRSWDYYYFWRWRGRCGAGCL